MNNYCLLARREQAALFAVLEQHEHHAFGEQHALHLADTELRVDHQLADEIAALAIVRCGAGAALRDAIGVEALDA